MPGSLMSSSQRWPGSLSPSPVLTASATAALGVLCHTARGHGQPFDPIDGEEGGGSRSGCGGLTATLNPNSINLPRSGFFMVYKV